jgi:hypothetical protein
MALMPTSLLALNHRIHPSLESFFEEAERRQSQLQLRAVSLCRWCGHGLFDSARGSGMKVRRWGQRRLMDRGEAERLLLMILVARRGHDAERGLAGLVAPEVARIPRLGRESPVPQRSSLSWS